MRDVLPFLHFVHLYRSYLGSDNALFCGLVCWFLYSRPSFDYHQELPLGVAYEGAHTFHDSRILRDAAFLLRLFAFGVSKGSREFFRLPFPSLRWFRILPPFVLANQVGFFQWSSTLKLSLFEYLTSSYHVSF